MERRDEERLYDSQDTLNRTLQATYVYRSYMFPVAFLGYVRGIEIGNFCFSHSANISA